MRTREKSKLDMSKTDNPSDVASRREVGVQDNPCTVTPQEVSQSRPEPMTVMLEKLISAVDGVSSKIGTIETRLTSLEGEVHNSGDSDCYISGIQPAVGEPLFGPQAVGGARPKIKKSKPVGSDIETLEGDIDSKQRKKKKQDKKGVHTVKAMPQEYVQQLSKYTDKTIIERKKKPTETMTLADAGLLSQNDIEELGNIGLGAAQAQATQFWTVETHEPMGPLGTAEQQKDLLDFLKSEGDTNKVVEQKIAWA